MNEYIIDFVAPLPPLNFRNVMQNCGCRKIHVHGNHAQLFARPENHRSVIDTLLEFVDAGLIQGIVSR